MRERAAADTARGTSSRRRPAGRRRRQLGAALAIPLALAWSAGGAARVVEESVAPAQVACVGDCDRDGEVTIAEVVRAVNIGTGVLTVDLCPDADATGTGTVTIDEVVGAVSAGLAGCPGPPPTPSATPTCANIAGGWVSEEKGTVTCEVEDGDGPQTEEIDGEETIEITQSGCSIGYQLESLNLSRAGGIDGTSILLVGPLLAPNDDLSFVENAVVLRGELRDDRIELRSEGSARGTVNGGAAFSCSGSSTAVMTETVPVVP